MNYRIKEILKSKGLSMEQLASYLGITRITLTRNINGNPTVDTLQKIANVLDVPITELFTINNENELTALIEYKGNFYKAKTITELKQIIIIMERKGIVYYNLWGRGEFRNLSESQDKQVVDINYNDNIFLEYCNQNLTETLENVDMWLRGLIASYARRRAGDDTDYLLEYYTDWLLHTRFLTKDTYNNIYEWCNDYSNFITNHFES